MEDLAPNRVTVEKNKKNDTYETEVAKIFSQRDGSRKPLNVEKRRDGMLMAKIPSAGSTPVPVALLMTALESRMTVKFSRQLQVCRINEVYCCEH